ncbi:hypothetical protein V8C35DRAFT_305329 [Trichoderma chlorosporum]
MSASDPQSAFDEALEEFKKDLKYLSPREIQDFRITTSEDLLRIIGELQARQHRERRLKDLSRLGHFLEAIDQYGQVVETFCNSNEVMSFLRGPIKWLVLATTAHAKAFDELLNAYEGIGKSLPLLTQYPALFQDNSHMVRILSLIYKEILAFHHILLRYFHLAQWQSVFDETWKTCKHRFSSNISTIYRLRSLIESQANSSRIEELHNELENSRKTEDSGFEDEDLRRLQSVHSWLDATNVDTDQHDFSKIRAEYPGTGRWLLDSTTFIEWFHPQCLIIPPLLWISGKPGAGKTILASLVVEEAQKLAPTPTVLYFYFKHGVSERDNILALSRSLLGQLLKQDRGLLPIFYQKFCCSGEAVLTSTALMEELLELGFGNCKSAYIILDGLDECPREQRKIVTQRFRQLVEDLPTTDSQKLRCLFFSQDDGAARKDFSGLESIEVSVEDTKHDIEEYCRIEAVKLKESLKMSDEQAGKIADTVAKSVEGLFLLARLIWANLSGHTSIARLEEELEPNVFPKGINDAYHRILDRISQETSPAAMEDTLMLLGWLVCAKRPLNWCDIQGMKSISLDEQLVDFERYGFGKNIKDICASLVETKSDGTIQFVHSTAKFFLIEYKVDLPAEELKLACLCIDYLNLPAFRDLNTERILNGDYCFMDYAVLYWLRHLEAGITSQTDDHERLMNELAESLEIFIDRYWNNPSANLTLANRHKEKLQFFKARDFYEKLEKSVASTKKQLKWFGEMREEEIALNLVHIVGNVRKALEQIVTQPLDASLRDTIQHRYGTNLFKCARFSCQFFTAGFSSSTERDKHISKHDRPFRCREEWCLGFKWGFATLLERNKHMKETHSPVVVLDEEFPTDRDVELSIQAHQPAANIQATQDEAVRSEVAAGSIQSQGSELAAVTQPIPRQRRPRQTEHRCPICSRTFTRRFNLTSHLLTHGQTREHECYQCGRSFARLSDRIRHESRHTGDRRHVCLGTLRNGERWGCGRAFARADTLAQHHESRVGRACIRPWQEEQEQARQQLEERTG